MLASGRGRWAVSQTPKLIPTFYRKDDDGKLWVEVIIATFMDKYGYQPRC